MEESGMVTIRVGGSSLQADQIIAVVIGSVNTGAFAAPKEKR